MNKNDLVESLAEEFEVTKSYARDLIDSAFQQTTEAAIQTTGFFSSWAFIKLVRKVHTQLS
jgi:hypothetical protein